MLQLAPLHEVEHVQPCSQHAGMTTGFELAPARSPKIKGAGAQSGAVDSSMDSGGRLLANPSYSCKQPINRAGLQHICHGWTLINGGRYGKTSRTKNTVLNICIGYFPINLTR